MVCHALVSNDLKAAVTAYCASAGLPAHDLTGSAMDFLTRHTGLKPNPNLNALHQLDETYKRRVAALEFTLNHDDGLGLATLGDADIVITGVSRTGKTPTSIYLAQQGYRVANVSLAQGVTPPQELLTLPNHKIVGFTINPQTLVMIRSRRQAAWHSGRTSYDDPAEVAREMAWSRHFFIERGWPILDITDQAVEETAARILDLLRISRIPAPPGRGGDMESI
jgi:[pyruvate, water dikinase]-phosphate phosphotransferase / [pyruvate, water dikinase] kinase